MFTEKEMSDALKWLFDLFQPEDYEAYDEEEVGCAALCLPEVCMALRDKAETAYEYSSAGSSITAAMDGVSADKLRTGLKTSVILFRLLKQNQEI